MFSHRNGRQPMTVVYSDGKEPDEDVFASISAHQPLGDLRYRNWASRSGMDMAASLTHWQAAASTAHRDAVTALRTADRNWTAHQRTNDRATAHDLFRAAIAAERQSLDAMQRLLEAVKFEAWISERLAIGERIAA